MQAPEADPVHLAVDHLFRHRAGQMVAVLTRIFGPERLDQVEDAVQEAMVRALRVWPYRGTPENPTAWLIQVAKNRLLDRLRRDKRWRGSDEEIEQALTSLQDESTNSTAAFAREVRDDQLRMIFMCCHPINSEDSQVALTLKTVGGFSTAEIARAFLAREAAVTKMLLRAKQRLRDHSVRLEMPAPDKLPSRLDAALQAVYLMFNEGYSALEGEALVRTDLCFEAVRLCELLAGHPQTDAPKTQALAALLCFQAARLAARCDAAGELLLLEQQDRSRWNPGLIRRGLHYFRQSAAGPELSDFHLEAEITACHALASRFDETEWPRMLACYEELLRRNRSPVVALNRIVALSRVHGVEAGLREIEAIREHRALKHYYPFHATHGELLRQAGRPHEAIACYRRALELTSSLPIRRFLQKRIEELTA
jgi:RNA polymerase sigma-70 factor (ECF subfamily)